MLLFFTPGFEDFNDSGPYFEEVLLGEDIPNLVVTLRPVGHSLQLLLGGVEVLEQDGSKETQQHDVAEDHQREEKEHNYVEVGCARLHEAVETVVPVLGHDRAEGHH